MLPVYYHSTEHKSIEEAFEAYYSSLSNNDGEFSNLLQADNHQQNEETQVVTENLPLQSGTQGDVSLSNASPSFQFLGPNEPEIHHQHVSIPAAINQNTEDGLSESSSNEYTNGLNIDDDELLQELCAPDAANPSNVCEYACSGVSEMDSKVDTSVQEGLPSGSSLQLLSHNKPEFHQYVSNPTAAYQYSGKQSLTNISFVNTSGQDGLDSSGYLHWPLYVQTTPVLPQTTPVNRLVLRYILNTQSGLPWLSLPSGRSPQLKSINVPQVILTPPPPPPPNQLYLVSCNTPVQNASLVAPRWPGRPRRAPLKAKTGDSVKCLECGRSYNATQFMHHVGRYHRGINKECLACGKNFPTRELTAKHMQSSHLGSKNYKCPLCTDNDKFYMHGSKLRTHLLRKHSFTPPASMEEYRVKPLRPKHKWWNQALPQGCVACWICNDVTQAGFLTDHMRECCPDFPGNTCYYCLKEFPDTEAVKIHISDAHSVRNGGLPQVKAMEVVDVDALPDLSGPNLNPADSSRN